MAVISRRRVLTMMAALPGMIAGGRGFAAWDPLWRWSGTALGADATITLAAGSRREAEAVMIVARAEMERLENLFSLYRAQSAVTRLNTAGSLDPVPREMVALLRLCAELNQATAGAFDPTIQPVWRALARGAPGGTAFQVGFGDVDFDARAVRFARRGMALTFNGIGQGYITDRIADLFRANGLTDILVNLGEYRALGRHPDGRAWQIGIGDSAGGAWDTVLPLKDSAIATSAPYGTTFDVGGTLAQMIDPKTMKPAARWQRVSVRGPSAAVADGFSTAFSIMDEAAIRDTLAQWPDYGALLVGDDGDRIRIRL